MEHKYTDAIAKHYAAYRPALHELILCRLIRPDEGVKNSLDVGCGTGYSTVALTEYSDHVFGLDSNQAMIDHATMHPKITYVKGDGEDFSIFGKLQFDLVSFAGSLSYLKTKGLKSELIRVLTPGGVVLAYDFQLMIDDLLARMNIDGSASGSNYNFEENLSDWPEFTSEIIDSDLVRLDLSVKEAAHVLLANSCRYQDFQNKFHETDPYDCLTDFIQRQDVELKLKTEIYFSRFCIS